MEFSNENQAWKVFKKDEAVRIFFSYFGHFMTFKSKVIEVGDSLRVDYPKTIQKNLQRKYERVPSTEESTLSFSVKETKIELGFPKSEEYDPADKPVLLEDLNFKDISSLVDAFRKNAALYADNYHLQIFRNKKPETLEERIITLSGKPLYLPKTSEGLPQKEVCGINRIVSKDLLFPKDQTAKLLPELEPEDLRTLFENRAAEGITSLLYTPILYQQYAVGYSYLATRGGGHEPLDKDTLKYTWQFSKILAYSLKLNGYFTNTLEVLTEYQSGLIDISAAGLMFAHPSQTLRRALPLYTDLNLELNMGNRKMKIDSRVMRTYQDKRTNYYGVQFLVIQPEDFRFLFEYIYGRPLTTEDEQLWEGGMAPPRLILN